MITAQRNSTVDTSGMDSHRGALDIGRIRTILEAIPYMCGVNRPPQDAAGGFALNTTSRATRPRDCLSYRGFDHHFSMELPHGLSPQLPRDRGHDFLLKVGNLELRLGLVTIIVIACLMNLLF